MTGWEDSCERRDRVMRWLLFGVLGGLLAVYFCADVAGWVPPVYSVRERSRKLFLPSAIGERYDNFDPDLCLGVAIGETRYRLNYANGHAIVTRPLFGVTEWEIPERFTFQGQDFTVTALDPFALLNAVGVRTLSLPATLNWLNGATALATKDLQTITLRQEAQAPRTFYPPFDALALPGDLEGAPPRHEGEEP